jgi:hypothetical protein
MSVKDYTQEEVSLANGFINTFPERDGTEGLADYYREATSRQLKPRERREIVRLIGILRKGDGESPLDKLTNILCESFEYKTAEIEGLKAKIYDLETQLDLAEDAAALYSRELADNSEGYRAEKRLLKGRLIECMKELEEIHQSKNDAVLFICMIIYIIVMALLVFMMFTNYDYNDINVLLLEA